MKGTEKYQKRKADSIPQENFKTPFNCDLKLSTIGVGTYVGSPDDDDDLKVKLLFLFLKKKRL